MVFLSIIDPDFKYFGVTLFYPILMPIQITFSWIEYTGGVWKCRQIHSRSFFLSKELTLGNYKNVKPSLRRHSFENIHLFFYHISAQQFSWSKYSSIITDPIIQQKTFGKLNCFRSAEYILQFLMGLLQYILNIFIRVFGRVNIVFFHCKWKQSFINNSRNRISELYMSSRST